MDAEHTNALIEEMKRRLPRIDDEVMRLINRAAESYISHPPPLPKVPKHMASESAKIKRAIDSVLNKLEGLDDNTYNSIRYYLKYETEEFGNFDGTDLPNFENMLKRISVYLFYYANSNERRGPKKNEALNGFIVALADAYEYSTERPASEGISSNRDHNEYKGEFFQFVLNCTNAAQIKYHSDPALGRRIKEVLKNRKRIYYKAYKKSQIALIRNPDTSYLPRGNKKYQ